MKKIRSLSSFLKGLGMIVCWVAFTIGCFIGTIESYKSLPQRPNTEFIFVLGFGVWLIGTAVFQRMINKVQQY